jgi:DNA-binding PadR family transcriptional regulator
MNNHLAMASSSRPSMSEPAYFVLAALMNGPLHGYAITKAVPQLTGGRVAVAVGTLYSVLDRLTQEGYVTVAGEEIVNGRARRYFSLTDAGRSALEDEAERMTQAARVVKRPGTKHIRVNPA